MIEVYKKNSFYINTLVGAVILLLTNNYFSYQQSLVLNQNDIKSYYEIFIASPSFPQNELSYHHAQRFLIPYVVGFFSKNLDVFVYINMIFVVITVVIFAKTVGRLKIDDNLKLIFVFMLIFNPFLFRYFLAIPLMVNDLVFVLGLSIVCYGVVTRSYALIVLGLIVSVVGRQTALVLLPGVVYYLFPYSESVLLKKYLKIILSLVITILIYYLEGVVASDFAGDNHNLVHLFGIFEWIKNDFSLKSLIYFLAISIMPILFSFIVFGYLLAKIAKSNFPIFPSNRVVITLLLFVLGICSQPILAGPDISGSNAVRLCALSLPASLILVAFMMQGYKSILSNTNSYLIIILLIISSFHHHWSILDSLMHRTTFTLIFLATLFTIILYLYRSIGAYKN